ncbi:MAG TPA: hypothetical protein DEG17_25565 [Cyanobacteria bacterium UBA11149]|nr:hypothetical protein [Cyanobacteria bacterium UBA11367]HBE59343.1 hypothetical protein [Cyanobacteria bacterium UBA11366]HBK63312.1 hypothetical protein [Cyanobacteria bacterium UBA11166]HBR76754.1 hypothetical protein [Cyanobacteria bacterium UBA11159]HBS68401.1 hypothetical protein [Cyanobacteria bacterium UBA11153]HBW92143.1 hypothetical protein [Cyanobacteria bacterium UBA11149]HCA95142.1 hypothetical protein [Cyanobacteria bacterium UBA9226]
MNAQQRYQTGKTPPTPSPRLTQMFLIAVILLGLGLIPIVYSPDTPAGQNIVPGETNLNQSN